MKVFYEQYRTLRDRNIPAVQAHAIAKHAAGVRLWEREHVTDYLADPGVKVELDGRTFTVVAEHDSDVRPDEFDCYDPADVAAWEADRWEYVIITVTTEVDGSEGSDSLGAVDIGDYWYTTSGLDYWQQVISSALDNDMFDGALEDAKPGITRQGVIF